jgi:hypothetical protein
MPRKTKTCMPVLLFKMRQAYGRKNRGWVWNYWRHSMKSKQRHSGGSYRRMKTMKAMYLKSGKDRKKANRQNKDVCNNNPY